MSEPVIAEMPPVTQKMSEVALVHESLNCCEQFNMLTKFSLKLTKYSLNSLNE